MIEGIIGSIQQDSAVSAAAALSATRYIAPIINAKSVPIINAKSIPIISARSYGKVQLEDPTDWRSFLRIADAHALKFDYQQAHHFWNRAIHYATCAGVSSGEVGIILMGEGFEHYKKNDFFRSLPYVLKAVECLSDVGISYEADLAHSYNLLAGIYFKQKEFAKAEEANLKALNIFQKRLTPQDVRLLRMYFQFAKIYESQQNYLRAEVFYRRALRHATDTLADEILICYKALLKSCGRDEEADKLNLP
jgi:tetratricopeptide (TPR) repeat protein